MVSLIDEKSDGSVLQRFTFTYDAAGNRTGIIDSNGARTTYTYDDKGRLTQDNTTGTNAHVYDYTYDANDNRLTSNESGSATTFKYNAFGQLVTSVAGGQTTTYSYDTNGNLTTILEPGSLRTTMAYDKENRMISNTDHDPGADPSDVTTVFTYDGDGLKQTEFEDLFGAMTTLVWDGMNVIQELP